MRPCKDNALFENSKDHENNRDFYVTSLNMVF